MIDLPSCRILATGRVRVPWNEIPELRKNIGAFRGQVLAPLVRQADEQTVLALAAVLRAIEEAGWGDCSFANWGIVASGQAFGRFRFHAALERFRRLQARGVSPLLAPHLPLHALAGTLSIALGTHGPQFGVSGNADHLSETLLTALGMSERENVEGLWAVACDIHPNTRLNEESEPTRPVVGQAVALAISRSAGALELTLGPGLQASSALTELLDWLEARALSPWLCGIGGVGVLEISRAVSAALKVA
jgi:hypothetical protein